MSDALDLFARLPENEEPSEEEYWNIINAMGDIMFEEWEAWFNNTHQIKPS